MELFAKALAPRILKFGYWTNERSTSEMDFILQKNGLIAPIEVKLGENLEFRSFTLFCDKFKPDLAVKTLTLPLRDNEKKCRTYHCMGLQL